MVLADSHRISRARSYSGQCTITQPCSFSYGTHTHYGSPLTRIHLPHTDSDDQAAAQSMHIPQPLISNLCRVSHQPGLATSAFARHYSRNHSCFLFLRVLRCFTSPRSPHTTYTFSGGYHDSRRGGFPHSEILESTPVYRLPEAYRRLPRPSSAPDAKASTICSYEFEHQE